MTDFSSLLRLVCLMLVTLCGDPALGDVRPGRGPLLGFVDDGKVWASTDSNPADFSCTILSVPVNANTSTTFQYCSFKAFTFPYRWRIAHNQFWAVSDEIERTVVVHWIPMADFDLYNFADDQKRRKLVQQRYPEDTSLDDHAVDIRPIQEMARALRFKTDPLDDDRLITEAYWDFQPTGSTKMTLFILHEKKIQLLDGEFTKLKKRDGFDWWKYEWAKQPKEVIQADFHAPFIVCPVADTHYFVTQFGECHGWRKDDRGKKSTFAVWSKDDQPIGRLITDTASGKTFAFTIPLERKDGPKAKAGYFELAAKPVFVEYDPAKIKKNNFEYPLKQIRECVDVLIADKKITAPAASTKDPQRR